MITSADGTRRPGWSFALAHPAHLVAVGFGAGLVPFAPGTFGTLLAFPLHWLLEPWLPGYTLFAVCALLFVAGAWCCALAGRALGVHDHGCLVIDETVAFLLVLAFTPAGVGWQIAAFLLFRFFDILKPQPIRHLDRTVRGGLGVMLDDLVAAFFTLLCLAAGKAFLT